MTGSARAPGRLVVVAAPLGGVAALSPRAGHALGHAEVVWAEAGAELVVPAVAGAAPNRLAPDTDVAAVVERVAAGATVVLVTAAGAPGSSGPAARLVGAVVDAGLPIEVVPAPVAAVAALVVSGLATDHVAVDGVLPPAGAERDARLAELAGERRTTALTEDGRRLAATLADVAAACGPDRPVAVAGAGAGAAPGPLAEMWRGTAADGVAWAAGHPLDGEVVLVVGAAAVVAVPEGDDAVRAALRAA
ncbi:MAG TPA: SAM-dependent methyltransferase, partial [Iamia sp.]|nr:SAM-dependent methyltransferase [Iamia sp.]